MSEDKWGVRTNVEEYKGAFYFAQTFSCETVQNARSPSIWKCPGWVWWHMHNMHNMHHMHNVHNMHNMHNMHSMLNMHNTHNILYSNNLISGSKTFHKLWQNFQFEIKQVFCGGTIGGFSRNLNLTEYKKNLAVYGKSVAIW